MADGRMSLGGRTTTKESYGFPDLPIREIVSILLDLGVLNLKDKDITEPKMEGVQGIYEHLIQTLMFKTKEEMNQAHFAGLSQLEYPVRYFVC
jgi:hypothetical protein